MSRKIFRRRRAFASALSIVLAGFSVGDIAAQTIDQSGLENVIVQTAMQEPVVNDESITADAYLQVEPVEESVSTPLAEPVPSYPSYASAVPCNCAANKDKEAAAMAAFKKAYGGVFYGNNFSYLNDPHFKGPTFFSDNFKNLDTPFGTMSFGGESRYRYHNERNHRGVGVTGNDDNFWLTRQRLYADWKLCDAVRLYGEVLDADSYGENFNPRPIEVNELDIQNLFADVKLFDNDFGKFTLRVGRQELLYGAQRTVSPLDWANTRRTFEGVRGLYQNGDTSLDMFWTEFVAVDPDDADEADSAQDFYGIYATQKNTGLGDLETYYLGYDDTRAGFSLHTIGSRVSGATKNKILYDFEGAYQFGEDVTAEDHSAGFFTAGLGRKVETNFLSPTVWFYYDYASGEEDFADAARGDGGYDHLFPLAHKYNGFMDLFGRKNLHDFNIFSLTPLNEKVSMIVWYHYFRLVEDTTPYSVVMTPYENPNAGGTQALSKDLGHEIDILFNINLNARNNILLGYSHFAAGDYYDPATIGPADEDNDADFFYAQFQTQY
ncbi:alginate export family protein [Neorhodopirellula pilleata]|uniref:Alginate export domain-containing protein n=1 Tax=Neorhodopirellula pilleata TaxID=2714738 RepID=A0A5C6AVU2_9BACT|nr:alginate export family protein [Neorhodopirellula pilleata]TWU03728.1 hypothetical protein Pla100_06580 [Neorhodopirellula pilleata]